MEEFSHTRVSKVLGAWRIHVIVARMGGKGTIIPHCRGSQNEGRWGALLLSQSVGAKSDRLLSGLLPLPGVKSHGRSRILFFCILKIVFDMFTVVINERIFVGMLFELIITMEFLAGNPINLEETK